MPVDRRRKLVGRSVTEDGTYVVADDSTVVIATIGWVALRRKARPCAGAGVALDEGDDGMSPRAELGGIDGRGAVIGTDEGDAMSPKAELEGIDGRGVIDTAAGC